MSQPNLGQSQLSQQEDELVSNTARSRRCTCLEQVANELTSFLQTPGVACGTNLGAVVENPRPVAEGANPDLVAMVAAFDSMTPEQQEDYCFDVVTKGELSAAFMLVHDENGNVRPGFSVEDLPEVAQLVASTAHYRCVVRAREFE